MLSDSEVEVDKQFAIRNNIVDKLKEDIFIPKTYTNHLSEKKRIKQKKYSEEDIENEIDNKFFYDNFLVNLNHSKEKVDANKINIFNSQKKIHTKKQNRSVVKRGKTIPRFSLIVCRMCGKIYSRIWLHIR